MQNLNVYMWVNTKILILMTVCSSFSMTTILLKFLIEVVQNKEVNHDVWRNSDVEGWESYPKLGWAFSGSGFHHGVDNILVWVFACFGIGLHLLHSNFHIIKWQ